MHGQKLVVLYMVFALCPPLSGAVKSKTRRLSEPYAVMPLTDVLLRQHDLNSAAPTSAAWVKLSRPGEYVAVIEYPAIKPVQTRVDRVLIYTRKPNTQAKSCSQVECWRILATIRRGSSIASHTVEKRLSLESEVLVVSWVAAAPTFSSESPTGGPSRALGDHRELTFESGLRVVLTPMTQR